MRNRAHLVAAAPPGGVMPWLRPCRNRWCPEAADQTGWCPAHHRAPFHGAAAMPDGWPRIRAAQLAREPLCRECGQPASDVHHRVARSVGGGNEPGNLESVCGPCHHRLTGRMHGAW
jgi:5-methylcytosine-specific restriction enzyme A